MKAEPSAGNSPRVTIISKVLLNPYVRLMRAAIEAAGVSCQVDREFGVPWLKAHRGQMDVVHIHWMEMLYQYPRLGQRLRRSISVVAAMVLARLWGIRLVYTVHNLAPHEQPHPIWSSLVDWFTFNLTDAIHVHDSVMAEQVARRYGRRRGVHTIAHGNYISAYPDECTREDARRLLEIDPEARVELANATEGVWGDPPFDRVKDVMKVSPSQRPERPSVARVKSVEEKDRLPCIVKSPRGVRNRKSCDVKPSRENAVRLETKRSSIRYDRRSESERSILRGSKPNTENESVFVPASRPRARAAPVPA